MLHLTHLTTLSNTAHGDPDNHQAYEFKQRNEMKLEGENKKKLTWLQNSLLRICRGLGQRL